MRPPQLTTALTHTTECQAETIDSMKINHHTMMDHPTTIKDRTMRAMDEAAIKMIPLLQTTRIETMLKSGPDGEIKIILGHFTGPRGPLLFPSLPFPPFQPLLSFSLVTYSFSTTFFLRLPHLLFTPQSYFCSYSFISALTPVPTFFSAVPLSASSSTYCLILILLLLP